MKKSILIPLVTISILAIVAGTSVGVWYAVTPSDDIELAIESVSADPETDTVTIEVTCENNQVGQKGYSEHSLWDLWLHTFLMCFSGIFRFA